MWLNVAMIKVKVGELRNHLSRYLKKVRHGAEITITDRETPIGKIVPYPSELEDFQIIDPPHGYGGLSKLNFPDLPTKIDPVEILLQDRRKR